MPIPPGYGGSLVSILAFRYVGVVRLLQNGDIPDAVMHEHSVAERQRLPGFDLHRLFKKGCRIDVVSRAGGAVPGRWVTRIVREVEDRRAAGDIPAAIELAREVDPGRMDRRRAVARGTVGKEELGLLPVAI